jgi:hypothetical protein
MAGVTDEVTMFPKLLRIHWQAAEGGYLDMNPAVSKY